MRVPRQLGYKSVKYVNRLTVTDSLKSFGKGLGSSARKAATRGTRASDRYGAVLIEEAFVFSLAGGLWRR